MGLRERILRHVLLLGLALAMASCQTYSHKMSSIKEALYAGEMSAAESLLEGASFLVANKKNRLLYLLERASLYHYQRQYQQAEQTYQKAADLASKLYTKSLTQGAMSFVVNDSTMDYAGEDYEIIAIHTMLSLLYIEMGELSKAQVEARRINTRLRELARDTEGKIGSYEWDAFALYLSGLIFEVSKDYDSAIVDYRKALATYENQYPGGTTPHGLVMSLYHLAKKRRRLDISSVLSQKYPDLTAAASRVSGAGLVVLAKGYPVIGKESESFFFNLDNQVLRYSWPVIPKIYRAMPEYRFQIDKKSGVLPKASGGFEVAQDYDDLARSVLAERRLALTAKSIARLVLKHRVAHEVSEMNPLLGLAVTIINLFSESADTRSWNLLPGKIAIKRYFLEPGSSYLITHSSPGVGSSQVVRKVVSQGRDLSFMILDYTHKSMISPKVSRALSAVP